MESKTKTTLKGQMTLVTLIALLLTLLVYMTLLPVLNPFIESTVTYLEADPNEMTDMIIMVLRLVPFVMLLAIILSALQYAIPRRSGID